MMRTMVVPEPGQWQRDRVPLEEVQGWLQMIEAGRGLDRLGMGVMFDVVRALDWELRAEESRRTMAQQVDGGYLSYAVAWGNLLVNELRLAREAWGEAMVAVTYSFAGAFGAPWVLWMDERLQRLMEAADAVVVDVGQWCERCGEALPAHVVEWVQLRQAAQNDPGNYRK